MTETPATHDAPQPTQPTGAHAATDAAGTTTAPSSMFAAARAALPPGALQRRLVQRRQSGQHPDVQRQSVAEQLPSQLDLRSVGASFTLPEGKVLTRGTGYDAKTAYPSELSLDVSQQALSITCAPSVVVDPIFPVQNMRFSGVTYDFATARPQVHVSLIGGLTEGFIDVTGRVRATVEELVRRAVQGSAMALPGYNPLTDPQLSATLARIMQNFSTLPSGPSGGGVGARDLSRPTMRASLALRSDFVQQAGSGGIRVAGGGLINVALRGGGTLADLVGAGSLPGAVATAHLEGLSLSSDAITVLSGGAPVAGLRALDVGRGGVVRVTSMELMGAARDGEAGETLLRLLGGALALASHGVPGEAALELSARSDSTRATIVPGITRGLIEDALTQAVQRLLRENARAIPGIDLAQALGLGG